MSNINDLVSEGFLDLIDKGVNHYYDNKQAYHTVFATCLGAVCAGGAFAKAVAPDSKIGKIGGNATTGILAAQAAYNKYHKNLK